MFFSNYVRNYLLCCIFPDKNSNPAVFKENHSTYLACFGAFHVKHVAPALIVLRTLILFSVLVYTIVTATDDLLTICGLFSFCTAMTSNIFLLAGMHYKRNNFLLPYFFIAVLFIISLLLHLFISLLDTANTKDTLHPKSLIHNLTLFGILYFEVYTALVVWSVFIYICDARMDYDVRRLERAKILAKRLQRLDRRSGDELISIVVGDDFVGEPDHSLMGLTVATRPHLISDRNSLAKCFI